MTPKRGLVLAALAMVAVAIGRELFTRRRPEASSPPARPSQVTAAAPATAPAVVVAPSSRPRRRRSWAGAVGIAALAFIVTVTTYAFAGTAPSRSGVAAPDPDPVVGAPGAPAATAPRASTPLPSPSTRPTTSGAQSPTPRPPPAATPTVAATSPSPATSPPPPAATPTVTPVTPPPTARPPTAPATPRPPVATPPANGRVSSVVRNGSRRRAVVALTFDDGYGRCGQIVSILNARGVRATFFPNSRYVGSSPGLWRAIAARHPIANHTADHPVLPRLSYTAMVDQLARAERVIERVTGRPMIKVFRPPYGAFDRRVLRAAAATGYHTTLMWDIDSGDGLGHGDAAVLRAATRGRSGSVILLHCGPAVTPRVLPRIIASYRARGFRFVTVPELIGRR